MATVVTLIPVEMKDGSRRLKLTSPFHPMVSERAHALGGTFNKAAAAWYFDPRDAEAVRALAVDLYGIDPLATTPPETVTLRVTVGPQTDAGVFGVGGESLWLAGREVLRRPGRDAAVRLGEGVVIVSGSFAARGGSMAYPALLDRQDKPVTIEIRDLPKVAVEKLLMDYEGRPAQSAFTVVTDAPAPDPVPAAAAQILALARQLTPDRRRRLAEQILALDEPA